nr:MAG TPA: hypothetical protein [Caudoviricetes sp.]
MIVKLNLIKKSAIKKASFLYPILHHERGDVNILNV